MRLITIVSAICSLAVIALPVPAFATIIYDQTLTTTPPAVATTVGTFTNCLAAQGCFGTAGLVDTPAGGNLPNFFTFNFSITPAQIAAVNNPGTGTLRVVASRDIGRRQTAPGVWGPATEYLVTTVDGSLLGNLFQDTLSTCPPGENEGNLTFGPNFHNDVVATDSFTIPAASFQSFAANGTIQVVLDPTGDPTGGTAGIGRLKIFSVNLTYDTTPIPEPAGFLLVALGLATLGCLKRPPRFSTRASDDCRESK